MLLFILGLFIGGILGVFLISAVTVGKWSDCNPEEYLNEKVEFMIHGRRKNDENN